MGIRIRQYAMTWTLAAIGLTTLAPAAGRAADAKVENYSNDTIYVAVAYNKWENTLAAEGWFAIKSNANRTFKAGNGADLHLRIEAAGREVTFAKHKTFRDWPVEPKRFRVLKESDDAKIRVLKWGPQLEHSRNIEKGGKLPEGWVEKRFFEIGSENVKLEVKP